MNSQEGLLNTKKIIKLITSIFSLVNLFSSTTRIFPFLHPQISNSNKLITNKTKYLFSTILKCFELKFYHLAVPAIYLNLYKCYTHQTRYISNKTIFNDTTCRFLAISCKHGNNWGLVKSKKVNDFCRCI